MSVSEAAYTALQSKYNLLRKAAAELEAATHPKACHDYYSGDSCGSEIDRRRLRRAAGSVRDILTPQRANHE